MTAIFKEYQFEANNAVDIVEGEHLEVTLQGRRVAFSVYGAVKTLSGEIVSEGVVTATHRSISERAVLNSDGTFRILGLIPGKAYYIKLESPDAERIMPLDLEVIIKENAPADVRDIKFFTVPKSLTKEVSGSIFFQEEEDQSQHSKLFKDQPQVVLELYEKGTASSSLPIRQGPLSISHYFQFSGLDRDK